MRNWTDTLENPGGLLAIFGNRCPTLSEVVLHELTLNRDGPRLILRFDVNTFPDSPPKKWVVSRYNRVQLKLLAVGVRKFSAEGFDTDGSINLIIASEDGVRIEGNSKTMSFVVISQTLHVDEISAYQDST